MAVPYNLRDKKMNSQSTNKENEFQSSKNSRIISKLHLKVRKNQQQRTLNIPTTGLFLVKNASYLIHFTLLEKSKKLINRARVIHIFGYVCIIYTNIYQNKNKSDRKIIFLFLLDTNIRKISDASYKSKCQDSTNSVHLIGFLGF